MGLLRWAIITILSSLVWGTVAHSAEGHLITAALHHDTGPGGVVKHDGITADPTIAGKLMSREQVHRLKARFHGHARFAEITSLVQADGDFLLSRAELERIWGDPLEDGPYALRLEAEDEHGGTLSSTDVAFTLDTTPPQATLYEPWNGGVTNLQPGFIDVAYLDASGIAVTTLGPDDLTIQNATTLLQPGRVKETRDGLFRYAYQGRLSEGVVQVTFVPGQIADMAGNVNVQHRERFEFSAFRPAFNGVPQRPRRLQIEPKLNPPHNEDSGGSVYLHSGEAFLRRVDLEIRGRGLHWRFERTYRSGWFHYETPLGHNWDFSDNRRLFVVAPATKPDRLQPDHLQVDQCRSIHGFQDCKVGDVVRVDGQGREDLYSRIVPINGTPTNRFYSPPGFYTELTQEHEGAGFEEDDRFIERDPDGTMTTYQHVIGGGAALWMTSITDRQGNTIQFQYNEAGQLQVVTDTLGRKIEYVYDGSRLRMVRDFIGRELRFDYDANGDLVAVTGPRVTDTPHGNDFPEGKTERYTYITLPPPGDPPPPPIHPYLPHNLLTVTAPNEVARGGMPREVYVYHITNDDEDIERVLEHTYGGTNHHGVPAGGKYTYIYLGGSPRSGTGSQPPPGGTPRPGRPPTPHPGDPILFFPTTIVTDRNGNRTEYEFGPRGNYTAVREFTNRDVRASDPFVYRARHRYDDDGQRLTVTSHEGNSSEYVFDEVSEDRGQQGNLLQATRRPDADRGGDQAAIVTTATYEPIYNQLRTNTEARGLDPAYRPPITLPDEGFPNTPRYTTTYTFDYQEGNNVAGLAEKLGITPAEVETRLAKAGIPMGLGDVNHDGRTDQLAGNRIRTERPAVNLLPGSHQARAEGGTRQQVVEVFVYNDFGQLTRETDPEGNVTTYEYYPARDPDGDGTINGDPLGDPVTGGYLRHMTRDALREPGRNSGTNPPATAIRTSYAYDPVGNVIREVDGRGIVTESVVNALNQTVQIIRAPALEPTVSEPIALEAFRYIERFWYDFNGNVVLHQREDRGNTSDVDGNLPNVLDLPIDTVLVDFEEGTDGVTLSYAEQGFEFSSGIGGTNRLELFTSGAGDRGLRMVTNSNQRAVFVSNPLSPVFTLRELTLSHLGGSEDEWVVESSAGGRQVLPPSGRVPFSGPAWTDIDSFRIFAATEADSGTGAILLDDFRFSPSPDPRGGGAFVDTVSKYDILDNRIETLQEVENGAAAHVLRTRYRYDANENVTLTIFPEGNATSAIYDERDLLFRTTRGAHTPGNRLEGGISSGSNTLTTLRDATKSWTANQWAGRTVWIADGTGKGHVRTIVSNTDTILTVDPSWGNIIPDATSAYEISLTLLEPVDVAVLENPFDFDVRGGLPCDCTSIAYDGNRNMTETVDAADTDLSPDNNDPALGPGDRTRYVYDGFDRRVSRIDSVGNQTVYQYDPAGNGIRELRFGPVGGPSPTSDRPLGVVLVDFEEGADGITLSYAEQGFEFSSGIGGTNRLELFTSGAGDRGLRFVTNSNQRAVFVSNPLSPVFTLRELTLSHLGGSLDEWVVESSAGGRQVLPPSGKVPFSGPAWTDIDSFRIFATTEADSGTGAILIQSVNLVSSNLLAATESLYDELSRRFQTDQVLFLNTMPTVRVPDVADGATDLGKQNLTPGDKHAIEGIGGVTILGRVSTRTEFDRKSRLTFTVEDDGDTSRTFYDGADRVVKTVDPEENTVESAYDANHNLIEQRQIDIAQGVTGAGGALHNGQSTGANGVRTLNDTTQSWRPYEWAGRTLQITGGTGAGQVRRVIDNTPNQLLVGADWDVTPDATSTYAILPVSLLDIGRSTGFNTEVTLKDATKTWAVDEWKGRTVDVTGGTGAGQVRKITGNNPFQLLVESAWDIIPDDTSRYAIYPRPQPGLTEVFLTTSFHDSLNRLQRQTDNLGQTTDARYDSRHNLVAMADAQSPVGGTIARRAFSNGPRTVNAVNSFGNVTLYYYDGLNRRTRQETALTVSGSGDGVHIGASIEGIKNDAGVPESFPPPADTTKGGGDGLIRLGTTYDDNSLISAQIDDQGNVTLSLYNNLNRRVTKTKGLTTNTEPLTKARILGSREIVTPDAATIDDPAVIPSGKINAQLAEARARLAGIAPLFPPLADQVHDNPPTTVVYGYDADSNILIVEDENDTEAFTKHDAVNRPIAVRVFRAGQTDTHGGDPIFAPSPVSDPSHPSTTFPPVAGTTKQNYQYDGLSRLVQATDDNDPVDDLDGSAVTSAFDSLTRVVEERQQLGALSPKAITTGWRAGNLRSTLIFPNGRAIKYTYDGLDRFNTITDDGAAMSLVGYHYLGRNRVLERRYPINGTRLTHLDDGGTMDIGYDGLRRQTQLRHLRTDTSLVVGFAHTYDRMNHKRGEDKFHHPTNNEGYAYDSAYRLTKFDRPDVAAIPPQHTAWDLDGAGNWTSVNGGAETRQHSSFNEITARNVGGTLTTLVHDDNGNLIDDGTKMFAWDFQNRLRTVRRKSDGQMLATYTYDARGRRVRKTVTNSGTLDGTTFYCYDDLRVIEERDGAERLSQQYVYGDYIDEVLVMDRNLDADDSATGLSDQRLFYHQNSLMHVYALTDTSASVVEGYLYDAYGHDTLYLPGGNGVVEFGGDDEIAAGGRSDVGNPYFFTGRHLDVETGLLYYRTRYHNPAFGRFISRDWIGCWGDVTNLGNGYAYVGNNPVLRLDPLGLAGGWEYSTQTTYDPSTGERCEQTCASRETTVDGKEVHETICSGKICTKDDPFIPGGPISIPSPESPSPPDPPKPKPVDPQKDKGGDMADCLVEATYTLETCTLTCPGFIVKWGAVFGAGFLGAEAGMKVGGQWGAVAGSIGAMIFTHSSVEESCAQDCWVQFRSGLRSCQRSRK